MYKLFNHSSITMDEVANESINLIITDPPYNTGMEYGEHVDIKPQAKHEEMLEIVTAEMYRVMKKDGLVIFETPIKIYRKGGDIFFYRMIASIMKKNSFFLLTQHDVYVEEKGSVLLCDWEDSKKKKDFFPSKEHRILVFGKTKINLPEGKPLGIYEYFQAEGHPCPSNWDYLKDILDLYFKAEFVVLDPFMGTGRLGELTLKRGGHFFGYELEKKYYKTAEKRMAILVDGVVR